MRKHLRTTAMSILVIALVACGSPNPAPQSHTIRPSYVEQIANHPAYNLDIIMNEVLAGVDPGTAQVQLDDMLASINGKIAGGIDEISLLQIEILNEQNSPDIFDNAINSIRRYPFVRYALPNSLLQPAYTPSEWSGQAGTADRTWAHRLIAMEEAWSITRGQRSGQAGTENSTPGSVARMAVVDAFLNAEHPDFRGRAKIQAIGENAGIFCEAIPAELDHGNHVAGIAAATGDYSASETAGSVAGMDWYSNINFYPMAAQSWYQRLLGTACLKTVSGATYGILMQSVLAASKSAHVINVSWAYNWAQRGIYPQSIETSSDKTKLIIDAAQKAWRSVMEQIPSTVLIVAAAGNNSDATNNKFVDALWSDGPLMVAGEYKDKIIVVASVGNPNYKQSQINNPCEYSKWMSDDNDIRLSGFSSIGAEVAAPGGGVISLGHAADQTLCMQGTSMAAPFVSGLASLVWDVNPALLAADVKRIILDGAKAGGKREPTQGYDIINAYESVALAMPTAATCGGAAMPRVSWTPRAPLAGHRSLDSAVVAFQNQLHVFGTDMAGTHRIYDVETNRWSTKNSVSTLGLNALAAGTAAGALYAFVPSLAARTFRYDPAQDTWLDVADFAHFTVLTPFAPGTLGNSIYILDTTKLFVFDTVGATWTTRADRTQGMGDGAVAVNGKLYVFGGENDGAATTSYDPRTNTWTTHAPAPLALGRTAVVPWFGLIGRFGGFHPTGAMSGAYVDTMYFYNPSTDTWCQGPSRLPKVANRPFVQIISGKYYFLDAEGGLWEGVIE